MFAVRMYNKRRYTLVITFVLTLLSLNDCISSKSPCEQLLANETKLVVIGRTYGKQVILLDNQWSGYKVSLKYLAKEVPFTLKLKSKKRITVDDLFPNWNSSWVDNGELKNAFLVYGPEKEMMMHLKVEHSGNHFALAVVQQKRQTVLLEQVDSTPVNIHELSTYETMHGLALTKEKDDKRTCLVSVTYQSDMIRKT